MQLTELEENKRDSVRRIDELERSCIVASKDAQQQEAQVLALQRQLKEAQVSIRNTEREADQVCCTLFHKALVGRFRSHSTWCSVASSVGSDITCIISTLTVNSCSVVCDHMESKERQHC